MWGRAVLYKFTDVSKGRTASNSILEDKDTALLTSTSEFIPVYRCHITEDRQQDSYITFSTGNARVPSHKGHIIAQNDLTNVTSRSHQRINIFCLYPLPYLSFRTQHENRWMYFYEIWYIKIFVRIGQQQKQTFYIQRDLRPFLRLSQTPVVHISP
jgi:hypothetical protein